MSENDRPLPNPPRTRFGRQVSRGDDGTGGLTADRLAQAAAEGRLEEVLQHEIPEGEHARRLALMMLGMSGITAPGMPGLSGMPEAAGISLQEPSGAAEAAAAPVPGAPPENAAPGVSGSAASSQVLAAAMQGDIAGLAALLREEHERRSGERVPEGGESAGGSPAISAETIPPRPEADAAAAACPGIDRALVDELIRVAAQNQVTVDWVLWRAVKLYLEEHRRTGRL